ncbi:hypothetical protein [Isoptericola sp. NPDC019571]|uniref:hypothetical protein n=1 Tax=Isoptericola sp. NPDC019571 TaxID=3364008 RepID=UPI0037AAB430
MTLWQATAPDGTVATFEASDDVDACDKHDLFACALAGCPDAFGWTFTSLDIHQRVVPEDVRARIDEALRSARSNDRGHDPGSGLD